MVCTIIWYQRYHWNMMNYNQFSNPTQNKDVIILSTLLSSIRYIDHISTTYSIILPTYSFALLFLFLRFRWQFYKIFIFIFGSNPRVWIWIFDVLIDSMYLNYLRYGVFFSFSNNDLRIDYWLKKCKLTTMVFSRLNVKATLSPLKFIVYGWS